MPPSLSWLIPDRVILLNMLDTTTAEELLASDRQLTQMMDDGTPPLHVVMDLTHARALPSLLTTHQIHFATHPGLGRGIVCGQANPVVRSIIQVGGRLLGLHMRVVNTRDEALAYLRQIDATLPPFVS